MILHNCTSILITIRFQKFGSSYIEYIPNDEQKAIGKRESLRFAFNYLVFVKYVGYTSDRELLFTITNGKEEGKVVYNIKNCIGYWVRCYQMKCLWMKK